MFYYELIHIHQDKSGKCSRYARRTPLRVAVGRLRITPLLHICASLRRGRARTWTLPWQGTPSRRRHWGGAGSWWACWSDTFWLGRWLLSQQPPPLPLFPTHPSQTWTRPAGLAVAGRRPLNPSRTRVESLSCLRTLPCSNLPLQSSFNFQVCDRLSFTGKFKFVIAASRSESRPLHSRVFATSVSGSLHSSFPSSVLPVGPPSSRLVTAPGAVMQPGEVRRAAPVMALPGQLAEPRSWTMLVVPVVSALGGSRAASRARRSCVPQRRWLTSYCDRPSITVAPVVNTPIQVIRRAGWCRQRRPSVPTATHMLLVTPKVWTRRLRSGLGPAYCTVISESGRTWPSSLRVDRLVTRSESTVLN